MTYKVNRRHPKLTEYSFHITIRQPNQFNYVDVQAGAQGQEKEGEHQQKADDNGGTKLGRSG